MATTCKNCGGNLFVKNGIVRKQQRYRCKICGTSFIPGDKRNKLSLEGKILAVLLHGEGKMSSRHISDLLDVSHVAILKCIKELSSRGLELNEDMSIKKLPSQDLFKFISQKSGLYKNENDWIVCELRPSASLIGFVILKPISEQNN